MSFGRITRCARRPATLSLAPAEVGSSRGTVTVGGTPVHIEQLGYP